MKESKFQMRDIPKIKQFEFNINEKYDSENGLVLDMDAETKVEKLEEGARVEFKMILFGDRKPEEKPFDLSMTMESTFEWSDDLNDAIIGDLLGINAPAILLSYMRPHISNITASAGFPPLIIPLMDFTENKRIDIIEEN